MGEVLEEREDSQVFDTIRKRATDGSEGNPTVDEVLEANKILPDLDATREYWIPTAEQTAALTAIEDAGQRAAAENAMFVAWRRATLEENARRKALNEVAKTGQGPQRKERHD